MRRRCRGTVLVIGFILFCNAEGWGENWKRLPVRDGGDFYYDAESITRPSKDVIRVWDKAVYSKKLVTATVKVLGERYKTLNHSKNLIELHCTEKKGRVLKIVYYSTDGGVLDSYNYSRELDWKFIVPGTVLDDLYKILCKQITRTKGEP